MTYVGRLETDAQASAGVLEGVGYVGFAVVADDGFGHGDRLRCCVLQPGIDGAHGLVGECRGGHGDRFGPSGPHRFRGDAAVELKIEAEWL